jgi:hypothetical protein
MMTSTSSAPPGVSAAATQKCFSTSRNDRIAPAWIKSCAEFHVLGSMKNSKSLSRYFCIAGRIVAKLNLVSAKLQKYGIFPVRANVGACKKKIF